MAVIIGIIISAIVGAFSWALVAGGSMGKSDSERYLEDEEQVRYLNEWNKKRERKRHRT